LHRLAHRGPEQIFVTDVFWGIGISRHRALRTAGDPQKYASLVRSEIAKFAPGRLAISEMHSMNTTIKSEQTGTRFNFLLIGLFAVVAAFLSIVGIYGEFQARCANVQRKLDFGSPLVLSRVVLSD
jgi:hypothetical protein